MIDFRSGCSYPHYHLVPKDFSKNIAFRRYILELGGKNGAARSEILRMCCEDILFYINVFCWTYDPRQNIRKMPFITYTSFQDKVIESICAGIDNGRDIVMPKSRCMGASWLGLTVFEWYWHFMPDVQFGLISRNEDYVDKREEPKSLFWKIDFLHDNQPKWLLPTGRHGLWSDPNRKLLLLRNADNGSVITGESTTGDMYRGGRLTALFWDEVAACHLDDGFRGLRSTRDVTKCRIFNSTPQGANNAFYQVVHETTAEVLRMHWTKHPIYNKGLYRATADEVILYDKDFTGVVDVLRKGEKKSRRVMFPDDYPFNLDGKIRSPWYDNELARCVSPMEAAQELDIDFLGSDYQFFDPETINILIDKYCCSPSFTGRVEFRSERMVADKLVRDENGPLRLWGDLGELLRVPRGLKYIIGADVSAGTGASNSALTIAEVETGRKVGVYLSPNIRPIQFASFAVMLCKLFNGAFLIWDASGPTGKTFTTQVVAQKYNYIYYRQTNDRVVKRISDQPGFFLNPEARATLLEEYRKALGDVAFINPSYTGLRECLYFIVQPGGKVEHSASRSSQDPSGARTAHGDETIADALACKGILTKGRINSPLQEVDIIPGTLAWRHQQAEVRPIEGVRELTADGW